MRILPAFLFLMIAVSGAASAQGNKIIVIDEYGNVSEVDAGAPPMTAAPQNLEQPSHKTEDKPSAKAKAPSLEKTAPDVLPPSADTTAPTAAAPVTKPVKKPAAQKPAVKKTVKKETPPARKDAGPKKNKSSEKRGAEKEQSQQAAPAQAAPVRDHVSAPSRLQRLGPSMTPEDAIRIALDAAPPARSVNAYPVNYKGTHAYEIVFRTEDGDHFVYVNRETGQIVK